MASVIEVNTGTLRSDVTDLRGEVKAIQGEIGALRQLSGVLSGAWEGEAKNAFIAALTGDIGRLEALVNEFDKLVTQTDDVKNEYEKCENSVTQIVAGIRV